MPVTARSRYAGLPTLQAPDASGVLRTQLPIRRYVPPPASAPRYAYQLTGAENLESLAWRAQGASDGWWRLADGNPLRFPFDWRSGERIDVVSLGSPGLIQRDRRF